MSQLGGAVVVPLLARILGSALLSVTVAAVLAVAYRWYVHERVPQGAAVLSGLAAVAVLLNTTAAFGQVLGGATGPLSLSVVVFNTVTFLLAGVVAPVGRWIGDRVAVDTVAVAGAAAVDTEVGWLVQVVGRVRAVELPSESEIEEIDGYEPVTAETKTELAEKTLLFSRRLSASDLREEFVTRLKSEYDVGHVDVELTGDGTVEFLALGRRETGLSHTLPPGSAAVAVTADPARSASSGDIVQVWTAPDAGRSARADGETPVGETVNGDSEIETEPSGGPDPRRIGLAEVRAIAGETVTLALDAALGTEIAGGDYRLVTLPAEPRADREFANLLRAADATMSPVRVEARSRATETTVAELPGLVVALAPATGPLVPLPTGDRAVTSGDTVYVVGTPDAIREVEKLATVGSGAEEVPPRAEESR